MKKNTVIGIIVVIILLIGGILMVRNANKRDAETPKATSYALVVSTLTPTVNTVSLTLPYLAIVQNDEDVILSSRIAARVEYLIPSGNKVKKGQVIARLDNTNLESSIKSINAQLEALKTALDNLKATHKRTLDLLAVKGASIERSQMEESKIAELEAKIEGSHQKLATLKNNLSYATIIAPTSGLVSKTMVNVGDMAMPGHPIASVKSNDGFSLLVRVPTELKISGVVLNNTKYDAIPLNSTFHGLAEYKVYVDDPNLTTGDRIEIAVEVFNGEAILLPFDAILNRNGNSYVLVVDQNHAKAQKVNIIETGEEGVVIGNTNIEGKEMVIAKQDILLKLLSGISLKTKEE